MGKVKKIIVSVICLGMIASLTGCGDKKTEDKPEKVNLSWYVNFSWFTADWGNNMVSKAIAEKNRV